MVIPAVLMIPDDPTPLLLPDLAVAKQANGVTIPTVGGAEVTGVFDIEYLVVLENTGTIELTNPQLTDDLTLSSNFGDAYNAAFIGTGTTQSSGLVVGPAIVSHTLASPSDLPTLNAGFLGGGANTDLFDGASGALQPGEQIVLSFTIRIDQSELDDGDANDASGVAPGNQVTGSADSAAGMVDDDSDHGLNPNTDNNDGAGTDDFTPLQIPQVRLWKSHADAVDNGDGTSTITVELRVENSGTVDLANLTLTEDLDAQFGQALISTSNPTISGGPSDPASVIPSTLINANWSGNTSLDVFDSAETGEMLAAGDEFTVSFDVIVDPDLLDDDSDYLENDDSGADDGSGIDSDEPTTAVVAEIAVVKAAGDAVANGENWDVPFTLVVENTGSVNLDMLTLFDDINARLIRVIALKWYSPLLSTPMVLTVSLRRLITRQLLVVAPWISWVHRLQTF